MCSQGIGAVLGDAIRDSVLCLVLRCPATHTRTANIELIAKIPCAWTVESSGSTDYQREKPEERSRGRQQPQYSYTGTLCWSLYIASICHNQNTGTTATAGTTPPYFHETLTRLEDLSQRLELQG